MSNALTRRLGLSEREANRIAKGVGPLKGIVDFLGDATRALERSRVAEAISRAVPWLGFTTQIASGVPVVAFLLKLFGRLTTETDPDALGYLAATFAYERSVEQAIHALGEPKKPKELTDDMKRAFEALRPAEDMRFAQLTFANALTHPFVREADGFLEIFAGAVGYDKTERRRLVAEVHSRFVVNLKTLLSQGSLREKFSPFLSRLELGVGELLAYEALFEHADLQRRLFEEAKVLGSEPFSLDQVYVDLDCGKLSWGEIQDGAAANARGERSKPLDPFAEAHGGRADLLSTVMDLLGDSDFKDAIVVQGVAGSGKSAFTLRLATELVREGLRPIRVRMRDVTFDRHAGEAIRRAIRLTDEVQPGPALLPGPPEDLFLGGAIWSDEITFRGARICPYVLILDGWDEISVSVNEGFRARMERLLEQVRSEYLSNRAVPIRVILTGRPTVALAEGSFLRDKTAVLTVRPFRPEQLETLLKHLSEALKQPADDAPKETVWSVDLKRYRPVLARYKKDFAKPVENRLDETRGSMDVLGLPLLAHIAVRLMADWQGPLSELVESPTTLYRSLVDLTCESAGQVGKLALDPAARQRLSGPPLRSLLRKTAAAIFIQGEESISFVELQRRLELDAKGLAEKAEQATNDNVLAALMVSFYFKGGQRELGCEFVHKSFREYLFAEAIVETLKDFGRSKRPEAAPRSAAWQDFADEPRLALARAFAELAAPQWLSLDVVGHLERLIEWEIGRGDAERGKKGAGRTTEPLDTRRWEAIREALADLWDWWADGVPMRPQPRRQGRGGIALEPSLADRLVDWATPQAVEWGDARLSPARASTMDAHLGDALFRLTALVHFHLAARAGFAERGATPEARWAGAGEPGRGVRPCQVELRDGSERWVLFTPSRSDADLFSSLILRVNGERFRPGGPFPLGTDARALDLRGVSLTVPSPETPPRRSTFRFANMKGATAIGACLYAASIEDALLQEAIFDRADLAGGWFEKSDLRDASLVRTDLQRAFLHEADLRGADLEGANLARAIVAHADLRGAILRNANLAGADFDGAKRDAPKGSPQSGPRALPEAPS